MVQNSEAQQFWSIACLLYIHVYIYISFYIYIIYSIYMCIYICIYMCIYVCFPFFVFDSIIISVYGYDGYVYLSLYRPT